MTRTSIASTETERVGGRYEVREQIAVGGMATIHRAYDRLAQREVAYKRLAIQDERSRARATALFQREYDTLARLPHPNIVEVYEYGKDAHGPYYAMELLTGSDLTAISPLPYREACRIIRDVASALALVHSRRLVHRDLSPNNVRLTSDGRAKLIDFGALTPFGKPREVVGTPSFMAPECLRGAELDQRSDLYSLGALAYFALTNRVPMRARSIEEALECLAHPVVAPSAHVPSIPKELDALVLSMLAEDRVARSASAAHLIDRLAVIADLAPEVDERRVALSYLAHPRLAGRADEEEALKSAVASAELGRGETVVVEGAEGLGRSALLDSLALHAQLSGAIVLRVRANERAGAFGLARTLTQLTATLYPDLTEPREAWRAFEAPSKANKPRANASPVELADRHALLIAGAQRALIEVSRVNPLVLVLDDLHLADSESLALLATLAQEVPQHKLALLTSTLTLDPHAADSAMNKLRETARTVVLRPLDESCVIELVESIFGEVPNTRRLAQWLHAQSGGVPGLALDLARFLLSRGSVRYTLGTFTLPHDVDADMESVNLSSAIRVRLDDFDAETGALAKMLALHDGALTAEQLAQATKRAPRDVLLSLEALKRLNLVSNFASAFALSGSSVRAALKSTTTPEEQRKLQLSLGHALLAAQGAPIAQRLSGALHLIDAGAEDEAASVVDLSVFGTGELAARWVRLLEALLVVYRKQGRAKEQRLRLLIPLVNAGFYGDLGAQRRHIDEALESVSRTCGLTLASRLAPYIGGKAAFAVGILYASIRRALTPKASRLSPVPQMIGEFIGMVVAGAATAASCIDSAAAKRYTRWLDPLSYLPKESSPYLFREYCLAIVETSAGDFAAASARYATLIPTFSKPMKNLPEPLRMAFYLGALNGRAQAEASSATPMTLELADELGRGDPFYAPHAECARMSYYGHRGEMQQAEVHRARAELLALRGGTSWSAVTVMTVRRAYGAILARDAIMLVQTIAELDRLSNLAPTLRTCKALCEAWLEALRGRHAQSIALYEHIIYTDEARHLSSWRADRALFAIVLNEAGQHERAKRVCIELLEQLPPGRSLDPTTSFARQQIAIADAHLGDCTGAAKQLDEVIEAIAHLQNPLQLGSAHRERAMVALLAKDRVAFDEHFAAMDRYFQSTRTPSLIQLSSALLAEAVQAGLRGDSRRPATANDNGEDALDASTVIESFEDEPSHLDTQKRAGS